MIKTPFIFFICCTLICLYGNSQQRFLSVQRFEYVWNKNSYKNRIIIPYSDSLKEAITESFQRALYERWNIQMPKVLLSVKPLGMLSNQPKFNTKIKDKQAGTWYMFLQIFDEGNLAYLYSNNYDILLTTLELKFKIINGENDSIIADKNLTVEVYRQPVPPDQIILKRLVACPGYFAPAFDSIAAWLVQSETESMKTLHLRPACLFIKNNFQKEPVSQLLFQGDDTSINLTTDTSFSFYTPGANYTKIKSHKNKGGNSATGALTLFTGLNINKVRVAEYVADFPFKEKDNTVYHCLVNYAEKESAEREREKEKNSDGSKSYSLKSGSYTLVERKTDSVFLNAITIADDTIATFTISYHRNSNEPINYKQYWDGSDSATIAPLPVEWNNTDKYDDVIVSCKNGNNSFIMKTANQNTAKEFYEDGRLVMIMYGETFPKKALLFESVSRQQLKTFTILSSLPYDYFNYSAY